MALNHRNSSPTVIVISSDDEADSIGKAKARPKGLASKRNRIVRQREVVAAIESLSGEPDRPNYLLGLPDAGMGDSASLEGDYIRKLRDFFPGIAIDYAHAIFAEAAAELGVEGVGDPAAREVVYELVVRRVLSESDYPTERERRSEREAKRKRGDKGKEQDWESLEWGGTEFGDERGQYLLDA